MMDDFDGHGLGECVEVCKACGGSGADPNGGTRGGIPCDYCEACNGTGGAPFEAPNWDAVSPPAQRPCSRCGAELPRNALYSVCEDESSCAMRAAAEAHDPIREEEDDAKWPDGDDGVKPGVDYRASVHRAGIDRLFPSVEERRRREHAALGAELDAAKSTAAKPCAACGGVGWQWRWKSPADAPWFAPYSGDQRKHVDTCSQTRDCPDCHGGEVTRETRG